MTEVCPFSRLDPERVFLETDLVIGLWDKYPVNPGHALLVPTRHVADWFEATPAAARGFCPRCGSSLFWAAHDEDTLSSALGALNAPTGLSLTKHIFTAFKGDYYDIADDLPQNDH